MLTLLLDHIPDWLFALAGAGVAAAAFRFLGWQGLAAALAALVVGVAYKKGREGGIEDIQAKVDAGNQAAVKRQKTIEDETHAMSEKQIDADNTRWIRPS